MQFTEMVVQLYYMLLLSASTDVWWLLCCGESYGCFLGARWASTRVSVQIIVPGNRQWSRTCEGPVERTAAIVSKDSLGIGKFRRFGINVQQM